MKFNTHINIIASIPDFGMIYRLLIEYSKHNSITEIEKLTIEQNAFGIRTLSSRKRFFSAIKSSFLHFQTSDHKDLVTSIFTNDPSLEIQKYITFLQFAINNNLFSLLTNDVLLKLLFQGRLTVNKSDIASYLYDLRDRNASQISWSNTTIDIISSKYLTLLKKLGFLSGSARKEFSQLMPADTTLVLLVYMIKSIGKNTLNFLESPFAPLLMSSQENLIKRLKKLAQNNFINVQMIGSDLRVDLDYSYKEIVNAI